MYLKLELGLCVLGNSLGQVQLVELAPASQSPRINTYYLIITEPTIGRSTK